MMPGELAWSELKRNEFEAEHGTAFKDLQEKPQKQWVSVWHKSSITSGERTRRVLRGKCP